MDVVEMLAALALAAFAILSVLSLGTIKKVLPSKGEGFVESMKDACQQAQDISDDLANKVRGDHNEYELITQTLGAVPHEQHQGHTGVCEGVSAEREDGGQVEADAGSDLGGSVDEPEADEPIQKSP
jgi:hypothetical protein